MKLSLEEMSRLAYALIAADDAVKDAEQALKDAKEKARLLREETVPNAMHELELTSLGLEDGRTITISQEVYSQASKADQPQIFKWLIEHDFDGLIKTEVKTIFGRGEREAALNLARSLEDNSLTVKFDEKVDAQTMKAFLREQIRKGADIPLDLFKATPIWVAKVK